MLLSESKTKKRIASCNAASPEASASDNESSDSEGGGGNVGWADSIAKVLNTTKPKTKKTLVLSRAKKIKPNEKAKPDEDYGFEVDGEVKDENPKEEKEAPSAAKPRKNRTLDLRTKPTWKDIERERALRKIATKGVVQLFNAVRTQQKDLQQQLDEAGPLDSRRDAVLNNIDKRKFLDVLMSGNRAKSMPVDNSVKIESDGTNSDDDDTDNGKTKKSQWSVLEKDFLTKKKTKHWDEDSDEESNSSAIDMSDDASDGD